MFVRFAITFLFLFIYIQNQAQNVSIKDILISGNKHTKEKVILRELNFEKGDSLIISMLAQTFEKNRQQILSTGLFNNAILNLKNYDVEQAVADLEIVLEENWYLFPVPIFELADRNFNVWWNEQNKSLDRINYGLRINHYNLTGARDPLKVKIQFGYTRKFEIKYGYPYWKLNNKLGIAGTIFYADNKEIAYKTEGNKTLFYKHEVDERVLLSRFRIGPELKYRPKVNMFHALRFEYHHNQINNLVVEILNENYFLNRSTDLRMFYLEYDFQIDKRIYATYPKGGWSLFANIKKEGLGIFNDVNNLNITIGGEKHWKLLPNLVLGNRLKAKTNLFREAVAFANNTGLGWDMDIVSGYELYVMDGIDFFINKNRLSYQLFDQNVRLYDFLPYQFQKVNLTIYLRANLDVAIVNEPVYIESNNLNNRWIYGYGPAIDFIMFNNFLFSFEYSFNDIGEQGLFFHNTIAF